MNIQQLRYVVAIANSGTFREAAEKKCTSVSRVCPSLRDLEKELGFKIFRRTSSGTFLTRRGMEFYEKAQELVKGFDVFQNQYANPEEEKKEFSISSQHYDFLPLWLPNSQSFIQRTKTSESLSRQQFKSWMKWLRVIVNWGLSTSISKIQKGSCNGWINWAWKSLTWFLSRRISICVRGHPLAKKESLVMEDLAHLPTVRFTQEKDEYLYYSENFVDTSSSSQLFNVTDRATLNGILERTDAYATGSGFLDSQSVNGITVIPLIDDLNNKMVYVKREEVDLSPVAEKFVQVMEAYFDEKR